MFQAEVDGQGACLVLVLAGQPPPGEGGSRAYARYQGGFALEQLPRVLEQVLLGIAIIGRQGELDDARRTVVGQGQQFGFLQLLVAIHQDQYPRLGVRRWAGQCRGAAIWQALLLDPGLGRGAAPEQQADADGEEDGDDQDALPVAFEHGSLSV